MERKHFLTLGAGLTVGSLMGKTPLSVSAPSKASQPTEWLNQWQENYGLPLPVEPNQDSPETDGPYWEFIRGLFPLNPKITFLNNGTMGITPLPVLEALNKSFRNLAENAAYPMHDGSFEEQLAKIIGCKGSELAITKNVSEGVNLACRAIPLKKGDEVIITRHEHVGGCAPWLYRAKTEGIVLKVIELGNTAAETLQRVKDAKTSKTKVLALPHIPCTIGQILPVKEICAWARENQIISAIDGAHPLGMLEFNLKDIGCDYYSGCFHKWLLGPIGTGFFFASEAILSQSVIHHVAAYSIDTFNMNTVPPSLGELVPKTARYSYGTFPGPMYDGAKAAMKFYLSVGPSLIEKRVKHLSQLLIDGLMAFNNQAKGPNGAAAASADGKRAAIVNEFDNAPPMLWKMHNSLGPIIQILTPLENISRGAQVGFIIKEQQKEGAQQTTKGSISVGTSAAIAKEAAAGIVKETAAVAKPQTASQRFCDYARKNSVILRYVAENDIHCVRVSTHYYNNQADLNRFFAVLTAFLKEEDWI